MANPYGIPEVLFADFEKMFQNMDADKSGTATKEEFAKYCEDFEGWKFNETELTNLMNEYDKNRDGTITKDEFYAAVKELIG